MLLPNLSAVTVAQITLDRLGGPRNAAIDSKATAEGGIEVVHTGHWSAQTIE
jgi:hypothetical protein